MLMSLQESIAKETEDRKIPVKVPSEQDDIPLFYSDMMPLLVREFIEHHSIALISHWPLHSFI